jgi:hypothetical protein
MDLAVCPAEAMAGAKLSPASTVAPEMSIVDEVKVPEPYPVFAMRITSEEEQLSFWPKAWLLNSKAVTQRGMPFNREAIFGLDVIRIVAAPWF